MSAPDDAVLVMAKAPRPGTVKTRLAPLLGDDGCAQLQALLISGATTLASRVAPAATFVAFSPSDAGPDLGPLVPKGAVLFAQRGGDLGQRLAAASGEVLAERTGPLVVIGTDIPALARRHLHAAFEKLAAGHDVVFGPAFDGGYYLVGLKRPAPSLFDLPPHLWGGPQVLSASLATAHALRLSVTTLDPLADLDTIDDARRLLAEPSLPGWLRRALTPSMMAAVTSASGPP